MIRPGFEVVAESSSWNELIRNADIVITGEGSLDRQTLEGKVPAGVVELARKLGKRVFALSAAQAAKLKSKNCSNNVFTLTGQCNSERREYAADTGIVADLWEQN